MKVTLKISVFSSQYKKTEIIILPINSCLQFFICIFNKTQSEMESILVECGVDRVQIEEKEFNSENKKVDESFSSVDDSCDNAVSKMDQEENLLNFIRVKPLHKDPTISDEKEQMGEGRFTIQKQRMSDQSSEEIVPKLAKSGREQKFKRSTNNSHKKFISVARRWMFKNNPVEVKYAFESKYRDFKSTRTYYFIILAYIKSVMTIQKQRAFFSHFQKEVSSKMSEYQRQIQNTNMENLKHFRSDEITDLKFSIQAAQLYFQGDIDKSIQCVYKKDKTAIVKKHHYEEALKIVKAIQAELELPNSVEDMIKKYGSKKQKTKSFQTEGSQKKQSKVQNQRQIRQSFLYSGFLDLQKALGLNENFFFNKPTQKAFRNTEIEQDHSSMVESIQKKDSEEKEKKKINTILVISPKNQQQASLGWESFQRKAGGFGFRPYRRQ